MEPQSKQKIHFQKVHLCCADSSNFGVVCIIVVPAHFRSSFMHAGPDPQKNQLKVKEEKQMKCSHVIHEFGREHDAGDEEAVDVERSNRQRRLPLREPVEVDVGNNVARWAAVCILEDSLEVALDGDAWPAEAMEG